MTTVVHDMAGSQTCSVNETAVILGVSTRLVYERARSGEIAPGVPVLKIGRRLRVPRAKLLAYAAGDLPPVAS